MNSTVGPYSTTTYTYTRSGYIRSKDFLLSSTVQVRSVAVGVYGSLESGVIAGRAALYDGLTSTLLMQSDLVQITAGATVNTIEFPLQRPVNSTAGWVVAYWWFSEASNGRFGVVHHRYFAPSGRAGPSWYCTDCSLVNGSFPTFLTPTVRVGPDRSVQTIDVSLRGVECSEQVERPVTDVSSTLQVVLDAIRDKHAPVPALGALILQTPVTNASAINSGVSVPVDARCPFLPVSTAVSGVRRADSVHPELEPVTVEDKWQSASDASIMTSLMANMLIEAGTLNLTTRVVDVFHYLPTAAQGNGCECRSGNSTRPSGYFSLSPYACTTVVHPSWDTITVAHLLTHAAGLSAMEPIVGIHSPLSAKLSAMEATAPTPSENCTGYPVPTRRLLLNRILTLRVPQPPLSADVPSQASPTLDGPSILLVALIIEEVMAQPWEEVVQLRLFSPLGMHSSGFGSPAPWVPLSTPAAQPYGHDRLWVNRSGGTNGTAVGGWEVHSSDLVDPRAWRPVSGVHLTLMDWARLTACHLQQGRNLTEAGFPSPPSTDWPVVNSPPYLLSAANWAAVHHLYWPPPSPPPSPSVSTGWSLSGLEVDTNNNGSWTQSLETFTDRWTAEVHMLPEDTDFTTPFAVLVAANVQLTPVARNDAHWAIQRMFTVWWSAEEQRRQNPIDPTPSVPLSSSSSSSSTGSSAVSSRMTPTATGLLLVAVLTAVSVTAIGMAVLCLLTIKRMDQQTSILSVTACGDVGEGASTEERQGEDNDEQKVEGERAQREHSELKRGLEDEQSSEQSTDAAALRSGHGLARGWGSGWGWTGRWTRAVDTKSPLSASLLAHT